MCMAINYRGEKMQVRSHKIYLMSEPPELIYQIVNTQSLPLEWLVPGGLIPSRVESTTTKEQEKLCEKRKKLEKAAQTTN